MFSSLRMPSGVAPMVVLEPENAALAAVKIIVLSDERIRAMVTSFQEQQRLNLMNDDKELLIKKYEQL